MDTKIVLKFGTDRDKTFNLTVPYASAAKSEQMMSDAMDTVMNLQTFTSTLGELIEKKSSQIINTETTIIK